MCPPLASLWAIRGAKQSTVAVRAPCAARRGSHPAAAMPTKIASLFCTGPGRRPRPASSSAHRRPQTSSAHRRAAGWGSSLPPTCFTCQCRWCGSSARRFVGLSVCVLRALQVEETQHGRSLQRRRGGRQRGEARHCGALRHRDAPHRRLGRCDNPLLPARAHGPQCDGRSAAASTRRAEARQARRQRPVWHRAMPHRPPGCCEHPPLSAPARGPRCGEGAPLRVLLLLMLLPLSGGPTHCF